MAKETFIFTILSCILLSILAWPSFLKAQSLDKDAVLEMEAFTSMEEAINDPEAVLRLKLFLKKGQSIAAEIGNFQGLRALEVGGPGLKTLPQNLGQIKSLEYVHLSECPSANLDQIFQVLGKCSALSALYLTDTEKGSPLPESIKLLKNLSELSLKGYQISSLPAGIIQLEQLQVLDLTQTGIDTLSPLMYRLGKLTHLQLGDSFTKIPACVLKMEALQSLSCAGSPIKNLHPWLARLPKLEKLGLIGSEIDLVKELKTLSKLKSLTHLNLAQMKLTQLPDGFEILNLKDLILSDNGFSALPPPILKMDYLRLLDLRNNRFIPESQEVIDQQLPRVKVIF